MSLSAILKWAGGKSRFKHRIEECYRKANSNQWLGNDELRFVDLFCGGLAAPLHILPKEVLINDLNPYLINFYEYVKENPIYEMKMVNEEKFYYDQRQTFNDILSDPNWKNYAKKEMAELFFYLNRACFNGLFRVNKSGKFNSPFGKNPYTKFDTWKEHTKLFKNWNFTNLHWRDVVIKGDTDFLFSDSPYDCDFTSYTAGGFNWEDQVELAHMLAKHPGPVLMTNSATDRIIELYSDLGFKIERVERHERIGSKADKGGKVAKEIHATRNI